MIHICPSSDPINERSPFIAGVVDVFSAFFYKLLYTYFLFYIPFSVDAEFLFDCFFCRQSVTIRVIRGLLQPADPEIHALLERGFLGVHHVVI